MIRAKLTLVIWGLLVVAVDLNLGAFDVVFDPIGFGMIATGLFSLGKFERSFSVAAWAAVAAIPASLATEPGSTVEFIQAVIQFFLVWYLCTGVMRLAAFQEKLPLAALAKQQRTLNTIACGVLVAVLFVGKAIPDFAPLLTVLLFLFGVVVLVMMLLRLRAASRVLILAPAP